MRVNWRVARQATDLVLPPVLALWVGALAWVYRSHYLVEWHHQGTNSDDPACRHLAQWVRDKSSCHMHLHALSLGQSLTFRSRPRLPSPLGTAANGSRTRAKVRAWLF